MNAQTAQPVGKVQLDKNMKAVAKTLKGRWNAPLAGYLFIAPWSLGFLILQLWPIIQSFYLSFTEYSPLEPARWIGLENYQDIAHDRLFFNSLKVTFLYVIASVPLKLLVALAVALPLNRNIRGISFTGPSFTCPL